MIEAKIYTLAELPAAMDAAATANRLECVVICRQQ